jgi:hypothetical protein
MRRRLGVGKERGGGGEGDVSKLPSTKKLDRSCILPLFAVFSFSPLSSCDMISRQGGREGRRGVRD